VSATPVPALKLILLFRAGWIKFQTGIGS